MYSNGVTPLTFGIVRQLVVELSVRSDPLTSLKDVKFKHSLDAVMLEINNEDPNKRCNYTIGIALDLSIKIVLKVKRSLLPLFSET